MAKKRYRSGNGLIKGGTINRRSFLKKITAVLGGMTLVNWGLFPFKGVGASMHGGNTSNNQKKLIFIAIDALHPKRVGPTHWMG